MKVLRLQPGLPSSLPGWVTGGSSRAVGMETHVSSDMRVTNLVRLLSELREHDSLARSDLARLTGLAVPTVHRLVSELDTLGFVCEVAPVADESRVGRPPAVFRLRGESGAVAGADVGNESTRLTLASLDGQVLISHTMPTSSIAKALVDGIATQILGMADEVGLQPGSLAAIGVGIASAVDPRTGVLHKPPQHVSWHGIPLAGELRHRLGCAVTVDQDDHLAALAECSSVGTVPGIGSVVVLEIGKGIGVGMTVGSRSLTGGHGRFGRIAQWPVSQSRGVRLPGRTLGECLVTDGLVAQYASRGGKLPIQDGLGLFAAARDGDAAARAVVAWAAREIADVVQRLQALCDPEAVVLGGGLAGGYDLLERELTHRASRADSIGGLPLPSVLGAFAPLTGALLAAQDSVLPWLLTQLTRN
jgi:predicted NBD/HSP70 family sugar kinase